MLYSVYILQMKTEGKRPMAKWKKGAISLVMTLIVLFSGYFAYQWIFIEKKVERIVDQYDHIELIDVKVQPHQISMQVRFSNQSLADYPRFYQTVQNEVGRRTTKIELVDQPNAVLSDSWNEIAFSVEEGISQKRYTMIQKSVIENAQKRNLHYEVLMKNEMICITLKQGNHYLYKVFNKEGKVIG